MTVIPRAIFLMSFICLAAPLLGHSAEPQGSAPAAPSRYTFSWPLSGDAPAPRGGSTRGPPLIADTTPSPAWEALRAAGLTAFERDRRAILAMVGQYRVTFDFLEVATFKPGAARDRPYQSWGTERVYVDQDTGRYISLVHILEMRVIQKDGSISEPMVQKHWRQDWQYQPKQLIEFKGHDHWQQRAVPARDRVGQWSQTVDQVDESPRYSSLGHWEHSASFSTWISAQTWRPLPRRELSVRKDYQVLAGTNRVTVTATGWLQEENNLKTVLDANGTVGTALPFLSREYGVARYERLRSADFAGADQYFARTQHFWQDVHAAWIALFQQRAQLSVPDADGPDDPSDKLFEYADQLAAGHAPAAPATQIILEAVVSRP